MRNIWQIYKRDIKRIITNPVALIIIVGLCILPSLYAWFNIYASWDPYGNTNGVKVAIVNKDEGGTLKEEDLNIGNDIVSELKNNNDIGWVFVDEDEAEYGLTHNKYYASIQIPENFTSDILTITTDEKVKPQLIYKVNEKSNAIAPKITSAGTKALLKNVTATFVDKVNGVIFDAFNTLGEEIDTNKSKILSVRDLVYKLNDNLDEIENVLQKADEGIITFSEFATEVNSSVPKIKESLAEAIAVSNNVNTLANTGKEDFEKTTDLVEIKLLEVKQFIDEFNSILQGYIDNRGESYKIEELIASLNDKVKAINTRLDSTTSFLEQMNKISGKFDNALKGLNELKTSVISVQEKLDSISNNVDAGFDFNSRVLGAILNTGNEISTGIDTRINSFKAEVKPLVNEIISGVIGISNSANELLSSAEKQIPTVENLLTLSLDASAKGESYISEFKGKFPELKEGIQGLTIKLRDVASDENINQIISILSNDSSVMGDFISSPVELVEESVFHIPNYGSAMSPFYSILSIWVGVLLLSSIITTEVDDLDNDIKPSINQKYFGRMLLFLTLGLIQSLIISVGDKYFLGVSMESTGLFIGFSLFTSVIFVLILYTLVSLLGNVGKAVGVILLVLQVAGSGGTFPIEVTPQFFQKLQPFLPFTYSIGALREAVGGPTWESVYRDGFIMLIYGVIALLLGVVLKRWVNGPVEKLQHKFKESGLSE